jgi:hypothetical protein
MSLGVSALICTCFLQIGGFNIKKHGCLQTK